MTKQFVSPINWSNFKIALSFGGANIPAGIGYRKNSGPQRRS
jgi:hypothetical protein